MWTIEEAREVIRRRMRKRVMSPETLTSGGNNIDRVSIMSPTISIDVRPTDSLEVDIGRVEQAFDYVLDDMNAMVKNTAKEGELTIVYVSDIRFNSSSMGSETVSIQINKISHNEWYHCML